MTLTLEPGARSDREQLRLAVRFEETEDAFLAGTTRARSIGSSSDR